MHRRLGLALAAAFTAGAGLSGGRPPASAAPSTQIAAAVGGNIVLFRADGTGRQTLTSSRIDGSPVMSPDGRMVAFLRWPGGLHPDSPGPSRHVVMLAAPGADGRYTVTRFSPRSPLTAPGRAVLSWQPGAQPPALAWFEAGNVVWRPLHGSARWALSVGPASPLDGYSHIAWSPDGREIATATGLGQGAGYPTALHVVVGNPSRQTQRTVTIRFRPGILSTGSNPARSLTPRGGSLTPRRGSLTPRRGGSYPVGDGLTFADDHHLLLGTVAKGAGYQLTGVFIVPDTGGVARMVLGNGNSVHGYPPFAPPLAGATQFQLSPDTRYTATDPNNHLWISGNVAAPRTIPVPRGRSCV
ncbi:MAG: PD40 domain-containing protein, partial [Chloroflexi bacterium]|nr:PD40 domain-containing protein [Chloroflexota bacterium]